MASIVLEFGIKKKLPDVPRGLPSFITVKICRFTIQNCPDEYVVGLSAGDEIGFDLIEAKEYFYATISRKVSLIGASHPIYIICIPHCFTTLDEMTIILDKFKAQFKDDLIVDA